MGQGKASRDLPDGKTGAQGLSITGPNGTNAQGLSITDDGLQDPRESGPRDQQAQRPASPDQPALQDPQARRAPQARTFRLSPITVLLRNYSRKFLIPRPVLRTA